MDVVLNPIVSNLGNTLIDFVNEKQHLIFGFSEEIRKLRDTLRFIQDVLDDAEQRQITEQHVKRWLSDLTDIMYDADDILDEYRFAAVRASQEKSFLCCRTPPFFARFRHVKLTLDLGYKIRFLNKTLEKICADGFKLDLMLSDWRRVVPPRAVRKTSCDVEPDIVGEAIEQDTRDLVDLLMRKDMDANPNMVVLAIVGMGGIGKTTLAKKIFLKLKADFQKSMLVCVSQEFAETDLLREMIRRAGGNPGRVWSEAELEDKVMHLMKDKKLLLVLDGVWDVQIWEKLLRGPLRVVAVGSRVLVTTRNLRVAERMEAIHVHQMKPLSVNDSWLLLRKKVIKNIEEERDVERLKDIGMEIVKKCEGIPLAITVAGGVLCARLSRKDWNQVARSSEWSWTRDLPEGVHQALYLSYKKLPSYLKPCFLHCSLFRGDSKLYKANLVKLWVAEGFVGNVEGEEYLSLEEIAEGYLNELIQRSLLKGYKEGIFGYTYCKMHNLLRSLCHSIARGESSVIRDIEDKEQQSTADDDSIKLRRLSILATKSQDIKPFLRSTQRHKTVRTLLLEKIMCLDDEDIDNCFKNFQRLRVVDLGKTMVQFLPKSVGNLLHLRYLNLLDCYSLKGLPESIARLKNLQFLILQGCTNLHTLPKGLVKLCNLRTLNLLDVPLEELPSGIAKLEHLNVLKGVVVSSISRDSNSSSRSSLCSLEEISKLQKLRELSISKLRMASDESEQKINGLNGLKALEDLVALDLFCGSLGGFKQQGASYTKEETIKIEKIFDMALHPPSCVRHILIDDYSGHQFPRWLMSSSISSLLIYLTNLTLRDCYNCSQLPPLGKLPNLESLDLVRLHAITSIGAEFFGYEEASTGDGLGHKCRGSQSSTSAPPLFPRLKRLRLEWLSSLVAWHWVPEDGGTMAMPRLNELVVDHCPKLLSLPEGLIHQAIHLTKLSITDSGNLKFHSLWSKNC